MATQKNDYKQLIEYISSSPYIPIIEWVRLCKSFNLPYKPSLFRDNYRERFCNYLKENTTTVSTVTKETGIPQKYLTQCKSYYEKKGKLIVVSIGICPTTGNKAQFISTNKALIASIKSKE